MYLISNTKAQPLELIATCAHELLGAALRLFRKTWNSARLAQFLGTLQAERELNEIASRVYSSSSASPAKGDRTVSLKLQIPTIA